MLEYERRNEFPKRGVQNIEKFKARVAATRESDMYKKKKIPTKYHHKKPVQCIDRFQIQLSKLRGEYIVFAVTMA
jgi:hypothetical protein